MIILSSSLFFLLSLLIFLNLFCECTFALLFYYHFVPLCQRLLRPEEPYRDYGRDRHKLMLRIVRRMERTSRVIGRPVVHILQHFLHDWFRHDDVPTSTQQQQQLSSSTDYSSNNNSKDTSFPLRASDLDQFFSWAFFGRDRSDLLPWMVEELERIHTILVRQTGLKIEPGATSPHLKPKRLTLDPIQPIYRPLAVYFLFALLRLFSYLFLISAGFRYYRTKHGLSYWFRPRGRTPSLASPISSVDDESNALPLLFFHGIAPGGVAVYLPMLLWGFGRDRRPLFFFETPGISFRICWKLSPTESETTQGVWEAVSTHLHHHFTNLCVVGHSFGTCQVTWLLRSAAAAAAAAAATAATNSTDTLASAAIPTAQQQQQQQLPRIRQVLLIDPVAISLSEPDVMTNFLYNREVKKKLKTKIGVVANELFIEHYLRRQFSWYNSELWLDDIPSDCKTIICLSEKDEILNAAKVKREVDLHRDDIGGSMTGGIVGPSINSNLQLIVWKDATHAYCISRPSVWKQMRMALRRQEQSILKEIRLKEL